MSRLKDETMEQDALLEYSSRFVHYYQENKGVVWGISIGLLLSAALIIGWVVWSQNQSQEAEILLGQAEELYLQGELDSALNGTEDTFFPGFIQIAENYSRTQSGNLANYYAAVILYEQGDIPTSLEYLNRFRAPEGIMGVGPVSLRAVLLSELGNYSDAAETFLEAAHWSENEATTPYNLLKAAENFELAGELDRTRELLIQVEDEYPNSPQAAEAKRLRGLLS